MSFLYAKDIGRTAEEAITLCKAKTPVRNQMAVELQKRVDAEIKKEKDDTSKWFYKLATVAITAHGQRFLDEVSICI